MNYGVDPHPARTAHRPDGLARSRGVQPTSASPVLGCTVRHRVASFLTNDSLMISTVSGASIPILARPFADVTTLT